MKFRIELGDVPARAQISIALDNEPGFPHEYAARHSAVIAALSLVRRFSVEFDTDQRAAVLIDSEGGYPYIAPGGSVAVGLSMDDRSVILQLPSDLPKSTTGFFGFSPQEAYALADLLMRKARECQP
jgi:hypothetical protein